MKRLVLLGAGGLCEPALADDFANSILRVVETLTCDAGYPHIGLAADAIGMSIRSLQRRLAAAGFSYAHLMAQGRLAKAAHLLRTTDTKVVDIALVVGYSDQAHFSRAFRRWTGTSPRDFRRLNRPAAPPSPPRATSMPRAASPRPYPPGTSAPIG